MKILPTKDMIIPTAIVAIAAGILVGYLKDKFMKPKV